MDILISLAVDYPVFVIFSFNIIQPCIHIDNALLFLMYTEPGIMCLSGETCLPVDLFQ